MLNKNVNLRVCQLNVFKNYKFFQNLNWNDLLDMKIKPPFKPDIRDYRHNIENCDLLFEEIINV
jgi:hypothetical protein